jgi:hypothetical protein
VAEAALLARGTRTLGRCSFDRAVKGTSTCEARRKAAAASGDAFLAAALLEGWSLSILRRVLL